MTISKFADSVRESGEERALSHGKMKTAPKIDPAPMLVNKSPRSDELSCNTFKPTTGINAGIAEINRANKKFRASTTWGPGAQRRYWTTVPKDSKKPSDRSLTCTAGCFHCQRARTIRRKQAALRAKTKFDPANGTSKAANAGPTIPERLSCKPPNITAEGSSASETIWGTIDVQAGALKANPTPMKSTETKMR